MNRSQVLAITLLLTLTFLILSSQTAVKAQTGASTTITDLKYPSEVAVQNGVAQAQVTVTVSYTGLPAGDYLAIAIFSMPGGGLVKGSGTSTPDSCLSNEGRRGAGNAYCYFIPPSGSGTESASFTIILESVQQLQYRYDYHLAADAGMLDPSLKVVNGTISVKPFTISITDSSKPPWVYLVITMIFGLFVALIVMFLMIRRRRARFSQLGHRVLPRRKSKILSALFAIGIGLGVLFSSSTGLARAVYFIVFVIICSLLYWRVLASYPEGAGATTEKSIKVSATIGQTCDAVPKAVINCGWKLTETEAGLLSGRFKGKIGRSLWFPIFGQLFRIDVKKLDEGSSEVNIQCEAYHQVWDHGQNSVMIEKFNTELDNILKSRMEQQTQPATPPTESKFCAYCGKPISAYARFCKACGKPQG